MKTKFRLAFSCCVLTLTAFGQHKNVAIGEFTAGAKQSIPAVVVSRKDPKFVVVKGAGSTFHLSNDFGATWEAVSVPGMEEAEWMSLLSDTKGTLYATYATTIDQHKRVVLAGSKDNGRTWTTPVPVAPTGGEQAYPSASLDVKGNFYVTWTERLTGADGKCESVIMLSVTSNGSKWSKPLRISLAGGDCDDEEKVATGGIPAVGPDGKMFVSWCNADKVYLDRSFGSGFWLENDIQVQTLTPGWMMAVDGYARMTSPPQLLVDQTKGTYHGCLYLAWADQKSGDGDTDVWFSRSNNYGDNWSTPNKLGTETALTDQYGARMTVDQTTGYIYVLFYDRGAHADDQTDVVLAYSSESGGSFKTVTISETPFVPDDQSGAGIYLDVAASNGVIVPVWTRTQDGKTGLWTTTIRQDELVKAGDQPKAKKKK